MRQAPMTVGTVRRLPQEIMDDVEPDEADQDEVERNDVVQQPGHEQDQNAGNQRNKGRDMFDGEGHRGSPVTGSGRSRRTHAPWRPPIKPDAAGRRLPRLMIPWPEGPAP